MASKARYEVVGLRQFQKNLEQITDAFDTGEALKPYFGEAGAIVSLRARRLVPVRTGALRDTIGPGITKRGVRIRAGFRSVPYAGPHNYGWREKNIKARFYINRAATETEPRWVAVLEAGIQKEIEKIAEGISS